MDDAPESDREPEDLYYLDAEDLADESYSDMGDATDPARQDDRKLENPENPDAESDSSVGEAADPAPQADRAPETAANQQRGAHPHPTHSPNNRDGPDDP
ncbi:hypothetical protein H7J55_20350 [Mycolicibacterium brisbanense]|nr:hypothetical protein [Mycolicibacterium brisbanense]MCV7159821.1 hypothetical protein [Mycolicibacterium brisbanense]